ncbi:MAG TPA: L-threonine 3-dehydrogenase [Candidatus Sulfotelmatobacter sp.]|nr:L-threonine 3-dehydrogenase [Candidatus Sulfotelmatobacter sp.]
MRTMRALVKEQAVPGAAIREVPVPEPGPGEILVQVQAASVCGTDVHIERWDAWAQANVKPPLVFGHEMAGLVVARGQGATRVPEGALVAAETHLVDWTCYQCRTGRANVCQHLRILGVGAPGVFAEYAVIPESNAWVSDGLAPEVAALQEPMGNAVHALFVEEIAGQSVAILGCGPIGLMAVAIARLAGARHIFATDLNLERLAVAGRMGAHEAIDAHEDVVARLRAATDGDGVDVVLEMSGAEAALHTGLRALTNGGRISLLGTHARPATIDVSAEMIFNGIRVYGITGRRMWETWYRTTALLEEGLDLSPIITHRLPLDRYAEAFELVAAGHAGKVVLLPQVTS